MNIRVGIIGGLCGLSIVAAGGCNKAQIGAKCNQPGRAAKAFRSTIRTQYPQWSDELKLRVALTDRGSYWRAWFQLPAGTIGGTAEANVEKKTCRVWKVEHSQ